MSEFIGHESVRDLETRLKRANTTARHLKQLLEFALDGVGAAELQKIGMEMAIDVTHSEGGYFHFFDERENVIDLATWSKSVLQTCEAEATMHYPIESAGIWADCARERRTVVHNDYQSIPDSEKGGLPQGHFTLVRHMSVPIFSRDRLVAIAGVGNKPEPYDDADIEQLELLLSCLWSVLQQGKARDVLERYSYEDGVTGISNRRRFDEVIESEWSRLRRKGERLSLIMVDIDYFKSFNDSYGHAQGDICLQKVANLLQQCYRRAGELVTRYGGEEFAIIVPYSSSEEVAEVAQAARQSIVDEAIPHSGSAVSEYVTVSMGVASMVPREGGFQQLIKLADENLYKAKSSGRNCVIAG